MHLWDDLLEKNSSKEEGFVWFRNQSFPITFEGRDVTVEVPDEGNMLTSWCLGREGGTGGQREGEGETERHGAGTGSTYTFQRLAP